MKSEDKLRKALDELFSESSGIKVEELSISDLWEKAGVSKATLYRYNNIVEEFYQKLDDYSKPNAKIKVRDNGNSKTRTTVASLKKELNDLKSDFDRQIAAARQEIYILHRIIEAKDKKIERMEARVDRQEAGSSVTIMGSRKDKV